MCFRIKLDDTTSSPRSSCSAKIVTPNPNFFGTDQFTYTAVDALTNAASSAATVTITVGGMLSIRVRGGAEAAIATAARVELWKRATSLGGVESLLEHRASVEGQGSPVPPDLLRLSVGIEDPEDLLADLKAALP